MDELNPTVREQEIYEEMELTPEMIKSIKEVRVGRDYNIEIVLNVPLDEFEEFKRHAASAGRGKNQKNKSQNPQKVGRCTSNAGIVVLDKTAGETISIVPKNAAHAILRC
mgnify:FL=1